MEKANLNAYGVTMACGKPTYSGMERPHWNPAQLPKNLKNYSSFDSVGPYVLTK